MAAIFGGIGSWTADETALMADRLAHRGGPCERRNAGPCLLAGPLSGGGHVTLVADAAVFNRDELGQDDASAPELLAVAWSNGGARGLDRLNADYAFAAWNEQTRELALGRDYLGSRPLFYATAPGRGLLFASEYKALLAVNEVPAKPDLEMIQYMQHCKLLPVGRTMLSSVRSVPPGTVLVFDERGTMKREEKLTVVPMSVRTMSEADATRVVADAFVDAVRRRSTDCGRVGISLSGGIDSMGLACTFRSVHPDIELHTFTAGSGADDPEMQAAALVAGHIKSVHHEVVVTPDIVERDLADIVWQLEDPLARSEVVPLYEVGCAAGGLVDLVLTGSASDGLFAGMPKHKLLWLATKAPFFKEPLREFYHLTQTGVPPRSLMGKMLGVAYFRGKLPPVPQVVGAHGKPDATVFPPMGPEFLNTFLHAGFQPGVSKWISKMERVFAASGLGHTSPFFDKEMIRTAFAVSDAWKIHNKQEKYILRAALRSLVPKEVLNIPKFPMRMKYDVPFADALDRLADRWLSPDRLQRRGFFNPDQIARLRRRDRTKPYPAEWGMRIWSAITAEIWAEHFIDRRGAPPAVAK